jgi:membrane protein implicated in regulation of membrane protease activity
MRLPPLIAWFMRQFDESPVLAVLIALAVVLVALVLARMALKLLLLFAILLALAIGASYLLLGEEKTERALRKGARETIERGGELLEDAQGAQPEQR